MTNKGHRSLTVWTRSRRLAVQVFRATASSAFRGDWGLRDQMRRSAVSVPSNIAEGSQRGSNRDSIRFFYIARGSAAELSTQVDIAGEVGLLDADQAKVFVAECEDLGAMLMRLIEARRRD